MGRTISEARAIVRDSSLIAAQASYSDAEVDRAIRASMEKALRETGASGDGNSVSLSSDTRTINLRSLIDSDFTARKWIKGYIDDEPVERVGYDRIAWLYHNHDTTGQPEVIGFFGDDEGHLWPKTDAAYTLKVLWEKPLISWTIGSTASSETDKELNVPEEWVDEALWFGAASMLVHGDPDQLQRSEGWQRFLQLLASVRGMDNPDNATARANDEDLI